MQFAFLLYPGVTALDVVGPYEILHRLPNADVRFVWKEPELVMTDSGVLALAATHALAHTMSPDVLIVPGSQANTPAMMADHEVLEWIREVHLVTHMTTSVCSGALILGAAGILRGLPATTHWAGMAALPRFGAEPRPDERVVRAGKVMTAAGVSAGIDMALQLAAEIAGDQVAKVEQLYIEYDPQPPFQTGHIARADPETVALAKAAAKHRSSHRPNMPSVRLRCKENPPAVPGVRNLYGGRIECALCSPPSRLPRWRHFWW